MKLTVTGKQLDVGDAFRSHIGDRLQSTLAKYFGDAIEVGVTVSHEGQRYRATVLAHVGRNIELFAEGWAHDPYPAFDDAAEHLAKRLRRQKRRLRDHTRAQGLAAAAAATAETAPAYVLQPDEHAEAAGQGADAPPVVAEMSAEILQLTVGQAVMRLDLSREPALLFRNSGHGGLNMVYRRSDGTIGWVDPREARGGHG